MHQSTTSFPTGARAAGQSDTPAGQRSFPLEHEAEFAEIQARAADGNYPATAMLAGLLFHTLLISERHFLGLTPSFFFWRGVPVTLGLLLLLLIPGSPTLARYARSLLCLVSWSAVAALLAGVTVSNSGTLLSIEVGIAALVLAVGWSARLPIAWTAALCGGMFAADALVLLGDQGSPASLKLQSLFAPAFAAGFALLAAWVRRQEARREFLAIRTAAFAGVESEAHAEDSRHLDPVTGVGSREAFEMRLRAAWEQATTRRNSVALLVFSIDDFAQKRREHGQRFSETLQTQVAGMLKEGLRRSDDMVARYDVHHFVVMLPGVGTDGATQIAERLRGCIEELVVYVGQQRHRATVTVGVASLRAKRATPREKLIECAVAALEQAKHTAPNTVCVEGRGCLPGMA